MLAPEALDVGELEAEREADRAMVAKVGQELSNLRVSAKQKDGILGLAQTEILTNRRKLQCSTAYTAFVQRMAGDRAVRAARAGLVAEARECVAGAASWGVVQGAVL